MARFLNALGTKGLRFKRKTGGWSARCPAHSDQHQSLSIDQGEKGVTLKCFTGCANDSIVAAVGLTMKDLFDDTPGDSTTRERRQQEPEGQRTLTATYQYGDGAGKVLAEKGRFELPGGKKTFLWRLPGTEKWSGLDGLPMSDLALWGAELVTAAPLDHWVYYCEGEKAALACRAAGLVAVTNGGGASTREFGKSLEVLRGRKVCLWPDNDGPGREYMAAVQARLRGVAKAVRVVNVPVPEKGDAYEYFSAGGDVATLEADAFTLTEPAVEFLGDDALRVRMPGGVGIVNFTFVEMEKTPRSLDAEVTIEVQEPGSTPEPYSEHLDLLSSSQRTQLRRDLEKLFGKEYDWTRLLNKACNLARDKYLALDRSFDLNDIEDDDGAEPFVVDPLVSSDAVTIFFGDGGSLKSYLVFTLALCVATGEDFLGMVTKCVPVMVIDYEDNKKNFRRRMKRIAAGLGLPEFIPGLIHYWPAKGIPLRDLAEAVRRKCVEEGIGLIIIDSAAPATGGDVEKAADSLAFFRSLHKIGVTTILLAHITKGGNTDYPFGSIFWHNEARRTWFVAREQDEESDDVDIGMYCRKVNDGPRPHPVMVQAHFTGRWGPVTLKSGQMQEAPALQQRRPLKYQIADVLAREPRLTLDQIAARLTPDATEATSETTRKAFRKSVENALAANKKMFVIVGQVANAKEGGRPLNLWGRVALGFS